MAYVRESFSYLVEKGRSWITPPKISDLRIVLLGKNHSNTSSVGNLILGTSAFDTETPPDSVDQYSETVRGQVDGRNITIIKAPNLYNPAFSAEEVTQKVKECVSLSDPGPHALLHVISPHVFTEEKRKRLEFILHCFNEKALSYSIVISTKHQYDQTHIRKTPDFQVLIKECHERHHKFIKSDKDFVCQLLKDVDKMVKENRGTHLVCEVFEHAGSVQTDAETAREEVVNTTDLPQDEKNTGSKQRTVEKQGITEAKPVARRTGKSQCTVMPDGAPSLKALNLVLCGNDGKLKASISNLILKQKEQRSESISECVARKTEVCGYLLHLVEMPALYNSQLSEEEMMHETRRCVSLCDPGVHAFLIVVPKGSFTDEQKAELDLIQRFFSSRINNHIIFLTNQQSNKEQVDKAVIESYGGRYECFSTNTKASEFINAVERLLRESQYSKYTMNMYYDAQFDTQLQYKTEIRALQQQITDLKTNRNQTQDAAKSPDTLRIVLLGKTGVGKSATGNTILGNEMFEEDFSDQSVTTCCLKKTVDINGRQITVIDTPGLFDTSVSNMEITKEITKCISMAAPGPHVFLLVLRLGRLTQEEIEAVKLIKDTFGEKSKMYTIVLFTGGDALKRKLIKEYMEQCGSDLKKLLFEFGNRYHAFNNNDRASNIQVSALLDKIDSMVSVNGGSCYTNEMFQQVEKELQDKQDRILKEKEEQIEREKQELKARYEAEIENIKIEMQKQKEEKEAELKRKEEDFEKKEQQMKEEMVEREERVREDFKKRKEEDELKMNKWIEQINREREENTKQWERQMEQNQELRDKKEEERRKSEQEWKENQRTEKESFMKKQEEMEKKKKEELEKLQQEYEQKSAEEEKRRKDLEEKIKLAEESKKKELQQQLSQQQEAERKMKQEKKKREEQQKNWEKEVSAMKEEWNLQQMQKQKQYECERQKAKEEQELNDKNRKEKEEQERKRIEDEANKKIQNMKEQMEAQREKDEKERRDKEEQHTRKLEHELQIQQSDFKKKREDEERIRSEVEQRNVDFIKEQHSKELENLKKRTEQEARNQAEKEFTAKLDKKVQEAEKKGFKEGRAKGSKEGRAKGFEEGCAKVEAERTRPGKGVDKFINWVCGSTNEEEGKKQN